MKLAKLTTILLAPFFLAALLSAAEAKVTVAADNVSVVVNGTTSVAKVETSVPVGATIKVAAEGESATVVLPDGSVVVLKPGSVLTVSSSSEEDGVSKTAVVLSGGTAVFSAKLAKGSSLSIATPTGVISGNKGTVSVTATAGLTTATSASGVWSVQNAKGGVSRLGPQQSVIVKAGDARITTRPATEAELRRTSTEGTSPVSESAPLPLVPGEEAKVDGVNIDARIDAQISEDSPAI